MVKFRKLLAAIVSLILILQLAALQAVADEVNDFIDGIAALASGDIIASGYCGGEGDGTNLSWTLTRNGVLSISGIGEMKEYSSPSWGSDGWEYDSTAPWFEKWHNRIISIIINNGVTSVGKYAFKELDNLRLVELPEGILSIGRYAFDYCSNLCDLEIPSSITSIGAYAFSRCSTLDYIVIPDGVTIINESTFKECTALDTVILPESITELGDESFRDCISLRNINIPSDVVKIGSYVFYNCSSLESIIIPDSVFEIGGWSFGNCVSLTLIILPDSIVKLGGSTFQGCTSLTSAVLPKRLNVIEGELFNNCISLSTITIPEKVTSIEYAAFKYCSSLTSINIPEKVVTIGSCAFEYCTQLTEIIIPRKVVEIGSKAFDGTSIKSIVIPKNVKSIGRELFPRDMTYIYCEAESKPSGWDDYWIYHCDNAIIYWGYDSANPTPPEGLLDIYHATVAQTSEDYQLISPTRESTPSKEMKSYVKDSTAESLYNTWSRMTKVIDSAVSDFSLLGRYLLVDKVDIYTAIIMDSLEESIKFDAISNYKKSYSANKDIYNSVYSILKTEYGYDKNVALHEVKDQLKGKKGEKLKKELLDKVELGWRMHGDGNFIDTKNYLDKLFGKIDTTLDVVSTFSDLITTTESYMNLIYLSEETKDILTEMKEKCSGNWAMQEALDRCCRALDDGLLQCLESEAIILGSYAIEQGASALCKLAMESICIACPMVGVVIAAYKSAKLLTKYVTNTDGTAESYYKMLALLEYESLIESVYKSSTDSFKNDHSLYKAQKYLAAADLLMQVQEMDADYAIKFCSEHRKSLVGGVSDWFREKFSDSSFKGFIDSYTSTKDLMKQRRNVFATAWASTFYRDYPQYVEFFKDKLEEAHRKRRQNSVVFTNGGGNGGGGGGAGGRTLSADSPEYSLSSNIYCYDEADSLVAYIENGICHAEGNVSILFDGESINFTFYDEQNYKIVTNGLDDGAMDINITTYEDTEVAKEVNYLNLSTNSAKEYSLTSNSDSFTLKDNSSVTHNPDYDSSVSAQKYKLTVNGGIASTNGDSDTVLELCAGQIVDITAYVPEGKEFIGWEADGTYLVFKDETSIITSFVMPAEDVEVIAYINDMKGHIHDIVEDQELLPTTISSGHTAGTHCSVCGDILSGNEIIPMKILGDVNDNGKLDSDDLTLLLNHIKGLSFLTPEQQQTADTNNDGTIDIRDFNYIYNTMMNK